MTTKNSGIEPIIEQKSQQKIHGCFHIMNYLRFRNFSFNMKANKDCRIEMTWGFGS